MTEEMNNNGKMNGMKILTAILVIVVVAGLLTQFIYSSMNDDEDQQDLGYTRFDNDRLSQDINNLPYENLSEEEKAGLLFMREEEKLARDVYLALFDVWSRNIFENIAESEDTHTGSIKLLIDKYSLSDPFIDERGIFNNSVLQGLYDSLVGNGSKSYLDAVMVGAEIEELDIKDIKTYLNQSDNADIEIVYENLLMGSRNHLRSFVSNIEKEDAEYDPVHITEEEFLAIINSEMESNKYRK